MEELGSEVRATRSCIERIPDSLYEWKPHEKSMQMGYLTLIVADIPRWITFTIEKGEIDFATFPQFKLSTTEALVKHFDQNMKKIREVLKAVSDEELEKEFTLKNAGQLLISDTKKNTIGSSINHLVHHRGQLTAYMRLNNIPVPSLYGPSADERSF